MVKKPFQKTNQKRKRNPAVSSEILLASGQISTLVKNKLNVLENMRIQVDQAIKRKDNVPVFNNLMPIVYSKEVLYLSYNNIKSNAGSMTPGTQNQTADEMSHKRLETISAQLKDGTYKFPDVRRIWLPKPGKNINWQKKKKENLLELGRPLGMPDFDAKLIQEAVRLVLNAIYEPIFEKSNVSFGFRPKKGCHDTVYKIRPQTQGMSTVIEGDIKDAFNNLNHDKLIVILKRRIQDEKFLGLIYGMCRAGIFDQLQNVRIDSLLGVPQGGIASPILWNIYMHEFDRYILNDIMELVHTINKRQKRTQTANGSPQYKFCMDRMKYTKDKYHNMTKNVQRSIKDLTATERKKAIEYLTEYKKFKARSMTMPSKRLDRVPIRILYLRYADDWILFTNAKPVFARYIRNKTATYLKDYLGLTLSLEKTKITNLIREEAKFLGFAIRKTQPKTAYTKTGSAKRVAGQTLYIGVDKERLINRMESRGYHKKRKPIEQPAWSVLTDFEIIGKYNAVIRGLMNYYAPIVNVRSSLNYYVYILEYSCYKTLCQKHRITIRKLLKTYGKPLKTNFVNKYDKEKNIELLTCQTYWQNLQTTVDKMKKNLSSKVIDQTLIASSDFLNNAKAFWRTAFKMSGRCVICGCKEHVQMHHIRHVKKYDGKHKEGFIKIMDLLNRKQIPVCKFHHDAIHDGKYDNISLSDLYDTRIATVENYLKLY